MTRVHRFSYSLPDASAALDRHCNIWLTAHPASSSRDPWAAGDPSVEPQAGGCHPHRDPNMFPAQAPETSSESARGNPQPLLPEKHLGFVKGWRQPRVSEQDSGTHPKGLRVPPPPPPAPQEHHLGSPLYCAALRPLSLAQVMSGLWRSGRWG